MNVAYSGMEAVMHLRVLLQLFQYRKMGEIEWREKEKKRKRWRNRDMAKMKMTLTSFMGPMLAFKCIHDIRMNDNANSSESVVYEYLMHCMH